MGIWDREGKWILDSISIRDSKYVWYIIWLQNTIRYQDIYRKRDRKWLLHNTDIWSGQCVRDIIWLEDTIRFQNICKKRDGK